MTAHVTVQMLKPAVERHLAPRAGEPGEFYEAGGSSSS